MRKNFIEVMKEICDDEKISSKQLSKALNTTQKELEQYQEGKKKPGIDFMAKFCKEFDLSLDYFLKTNMRECMSDDLVSVQNNRGKLAIFDRKQGAYLTEYLYDLIDISSCGRHIARKRISADDYKDIIIDNKGDTLEFPNYRLTVVGNTFEYGVYFPATNVLDNKEYLLDVNGKALSKGYNYISGCVNVPQCSEPKGYELFWGERPEGKQAKHDLLSKNGSIVKFKVEKNTYKQEVRRNCTAPRYFIMPELGTIEEAVAALQKYGKTIVTFLPKEIFVVEENYKVLVTKLNNVALKEMRNGETYETVYDTLKHVFKMMNKLWDIWLNNGKNFNEILDIDSLLNNLKHKYFQIKTDKIAKATQI